MSAVRMVAYGAIEIPVVDTTINYASAQLRNELIDKRQARDEIYKLVVDELARYGLLLRHTVHPYPYPQRHHKEWVLFGPLRGAPAGFPMRQEIAKGAYIECCIAAAEYLDALPPVAEG